MALASMFELSVCSFPSLSLFSSFSPMVQSAVWSLSSAHLACLFLKMSCLFWDIKSPHPLKSTGCQQNVLAIKLPTFFLCLSKSCTCKHVNAFGFMVKLFCHVQDVIFSIQDNTFSLKKSMKTMDVTAVQY